MEKHPTQCIVGDCPLYGRYEGYCTKHVNAGTLSRIYNAPAGTPRVSGQWKGGYKLSFKDREEMIAEALDSSITLTKIAQRYGVSISYVSKLVKEAKAKRDEPRTVCKYARGVCVGQSSETDVRREPECEST
jgi:transposase-like protein